MYFNPFPLNSGAQPSSTSTFTLVSSGRGKPQLLIDGFRLLLNKPPKDKNSTTYFLCAHQNCSGTAATDGGLDQDSIRLRYHNKYPRVHNHAPDEVQNLITKHLHDFRLSAWANPNQGPKAAYDRLTEEKLCVMPDSLKGEFLQKLPSYESVKSQFYRIKVKCQPKGRKRINSEDND